MPCPAWGGTRLDAVLVLLRGVLKAVGKHGQQRRHQHKRGPAGDGVPCGRRGGAGQAEGQREFCRAFEGACLRSQRRRLRPRSQLKVLRAAEEDWVTLGRPRKRYPTNGPTILAVFWVMRYLPSRTWAQRGV